VRLKTGGNAKLSYINDQVFVREKKSRPDIGRLKLFAYV
jgi:hypothetical protein